MADSPAKRHFARIMAAKEAAQKEPGALMEGAGIYEQHMMVLQDHRARLKNIQSDEGKAQFKRNVLPEYQAYIAGVLDADSGAQDTVVSTVMVWLIDAGFYDAALDVATYMLRHKLALPDQFKRTTGCAVAEEIAEAALSAQQTGGEFDYTLLARAAEVTAGEDMPDEVRAKLYLAAGRAVVRRASDEAPLPADVADKCVADLRRAIELNPNCGGKKDLERAERWLRKAAPPSNEPTGTSATDQGDTPDTNTPPPDKTDG